ncbi:hypothetical protein BGX24_007249 [Mortierella sp. AD032]|nr:hypothetical protein BGX24_007249 [Mortierella sp. AD032]
MSPTPTGHVHRAWRAKPTLTLAALTVILLSSTLVQGKQQAPSNSSPTTPILAADDDVCATLWGRQECGFLGITKDGCQQRQCCWSPTLVPVPWCFQKKNEEYLCAADVVTRRDCGYLGIDSKECNDRNCCWDPTPSNLNAPFCFLKQHSCKGYEVKTVEESETGTVLHLGLAGGAQGCSRFGQDIPNLAVHIDYETESRVRVKIIDSDNKRYEIPAFALPNPESTARRNAKRDYTVRYNKNPFTFAITRVSTGEVIFDSSVAGMDSLVFEDEYLEISSVLPEDANIFGLGEVVTAFRRDPRGTRQTMWARDAATPVDENLYGSHPFHLEMRKDLAHGVFLRNSNGMDVIITPKKITYKVIGGILDFTIFLGPTPTDVIKQYTELIGRPHMPPAWSLGFHQSRYGYNNIGEVEEVVKRYRQENLPLDGVWIDIDYMDAFKDFTYDETKFPQARMRSLAGDLAAHNQSMVLIIDPGIPITPGYEPYDSGMKEDIFIKTLTGKPVEGRVWPGQTYYPDFMNTNETWAYWQRQLHKTREDIGENVYPWIDMNEPANFCNGPCTKDSPGFNPALDKENAANAFLTNALADRDKDIRIPAEIEILKKRQDKAAPVNLKYAINNAGRQAPLDEKTLAENAVHKNGLRLTDTHNLYGHTEAMATHHALLQLKPDTRPFILTRSSFPGTGDNWSEWSHLYFSVPGVLSFGLFGVPFTGADICGFIGNTTEELCLRWHQLGALYPFARNHNTIGAASQEPYVWPKSVLPAARQALQIRYSLLPYLYTLFDRAHKSGNPVWRPLFFGFPQDPSFVLKIDRQFLLGDAILVSPALYKGLIQVKAYFPGKGRWFDLWTHQCVIEADRDLAHSALKLKARAAKAKAAEGGEDERAHRYKFLPAKVESDPIPMSLQGGHIITIHQTTKLTVAETRLQPLGLIVALDETGFAKGEIYVDDGTSVNNQVAANVTWELHAGKQLISNALLKWPGQAAGAQDVGGSRVEEMSAAEAQAFRVQMGHSDRIEKVVVLGLNFARLGGEQDLDLNVAASQVGFDVTGSGSRTIVGGPQQLHRQGQKQQQRHRRRSQEVVEDEQDNFFTDAEAAAQSPEKRPVAAARVNALQELNINGVAVSFGGQGGVAPVNRTKGVDAATGLGWEINEAAGSLTLTGLKIDLFAGWFIHWKLE